MNRLVAFLSGVLFAVGLAIAGMTQPSKVVGFLDFAGDWDPSLAFVMGGAILVYLPLHRLALRREQPLFEGRFNLPTARLIDARLIVGSALFGAGWGLGGFCPGPALASTASGSMAAIVFTLAMLAGMFIHAQAEAAVKRAEANGAENPATAQS